MCARARTHTHVHKSTSMHIHTPLLSSFEGEGSHVTLPFYKKWRTKQKKPRTCSFSLDMKNHKPVNKKKSCPKATIMAVDSYQVKWLLDTHAFSNTCSTPTSNFRNCVRAEIQYKAIKKSIERPKRKASVLLLFFR